MNAVFYQSNRDKLYDRLPDNSVTLLFAGRAPRRSADDFYRFFADRNFTYMTGTDRERFIMMACKQGGLVEEWLFIERPEPDREVWTGRRLTESEVREASGIKNILFIEQFEAHLQQRFKTGKYTHICLNLDRLAADQLPDISHDFARVVRERYPYLEITNIYTIICAMRVFKTSEELSCMREAMELTNKGIQAMMKKCRPGMAEYAIEAEFNYVLAQVGVRDGAFKPIVASGNNTFYLHYDDPCGIAPDGGLVLVDVGAIKGRYCVDISRVFPANGRFSDRQRQIYSIALEANKAVMAMAKPGASFAQVYETCKQTVFEGLKDIGLVTDYAETGKYFWHGVAHYVGLDVHDVGLYDQPIAEGMVFTDDAGVYVREWGIGLRIEDNLLITADGCENLSQDIIREIDDIETIMRG